MRIKTLITRFESTQKPVLIFCKLGIYNKIQYRENTVFWLLFVSG